VARARRIAPGEYCVHFTFQPNNVTATILGGLGQISASSETACVFGLESNNTYVQTGNTTGSLTSRAFYIVGN
jgi:hypothetical protein